MAHSLSVESKITSVPNILKNVILRRPSSETIAMTQSFPFMFTATKMTEKIKLTIDVTKELDFGAKSEEEICFGDFKFKITKVNGQNCQF